MRKRLRCRAILGAALLTSIGLSACAQTPTCDDPRALAILWQPLGDYLTVVLRMRGTPRMTVQHEFRDFVTVSRGERYVRCRANLEVWFEPPLPNASPLSDKPATYIVELTDDGRLIVRDDDGVSRP